MHSIISSFASTIFIFIKYVTVHHVKDMYVWIELQPWTFYKKLLPSATKLWQGNVFTPVCQSFCSQGRCLADTLPGQTPPGQTHPQQTPSGQTSPQADTPEQTLQADTPWTDTPLGRNLPQADPLRRPLQRTVRILLECFLVMKLQSPPHNPKLLDSGHVS